ncbi:MAG: dipeptidase [Polyangiales bacterium]
MRRLGRDPGALRAARALHRLAPPIDLHADPLLWARWLGYDLNRIHRPPLPWAWFGGHVDVPRMLAGGMGGQVFTLVSVPGLDGDHKRSCHRQIDLLEQAVAASRGLLRLARSKVELDTVTAQGALFGILGMEGAHPLGDNLAALDHFFDRGLRLLGLVHFSANACAVPAVGLGADPARGLSDFGRYVIERCEALGIVVDLAHLNRRGTLEACRLAQKPMLVSHTGLAGVHDMWRNIDDTQLQAVADTGGAVGIIFCPHFLGADGIGAVVQHIRYAIDKVGADAVALGSDWDGFIRPTRGLTQPSDLPALTAALLQTDMPEDVIQKVLRGNALRVLRACLPAVGP